MCKLNVRSGVGREIKELTNGRAVVSIASLHHRGQTQGSLAAGVSVISHIPVVLSG
jgi:hypothetical protein